MNKVKQYIDDRRVYFEAAALGAGLGVLFVGTTVIAARVGANEATRVMAQQLRSGVPIVAKFNDQEIASNIVRALKDIKAAEKAAKIAKEIV